VGKLRTLCGGKGKKYLIPVDEVERSFQQRRKKWIGTRGRGKPLTWP
jgi:hypothetical protein